MSYRIRVEKELEFIRVSYAGYVTLNHRMDAITERLVEYSDIISSMNYLIDLRQVENTLRPIEREVFGSYVASRGEFRNSKIATLIMPEQDRDVALFEITSDERLEYKVFDSEHEAISWLIEEGK